MNQKTSDKLVKKAQMLLTQNPFDEAHDLDHAEAVWQTAKDIAGNINHNLNLESLKIAAYWHDVLVERIDNSQFENRENQVDKTADYLERLMHDMNINGSLVKITVDAVRNHEYKRNQKSTEAKVLFDADKLEALSIDRVKRVLSSVANKKMSRIKLWMYIKAGKIWLKELDKKFHFDDTRKIFEQRKKKIKEAMETDKALIEFKTEHNLDISELLK